MKVWENISFVKLPNKVNFREIHLSICFFVVVLLLLQNRIVKSMLWVKPEDRPEASQLKVDLEECSRTLELKKIERDSKTV